MKHPSLIRLLPEKLQKGCATGHLPTRKVHVCIPYACVQLPLANSLLHSFSMYLSRMSPSSLTTQGGLQISRRRNRSGEMLHGMCCTYIFLQTLFVHYCSQRYYFPARHGQLVLQLLCSFRVYLFVRLHYVIASFLPMVNNSPITNTAPTIQSVCSNSVFAFPVTQRVNKVNCTCMQSNHQCVCLCTYRVIPNVHVILPWLQYSMRSRCSLAVIASYVARISLYNRLNETCYTCTNHAVFLDKNINLLHDPSNLLAAQNSHLCIPYSL